MVTRVHYVEVRTNFTTGSLEGLTAIKATTIEPSYCVLAGYD